MFHSLKRVEPFDMFDLYYIQVGQYTHPMGRGQPPWAANEFHHSRWNLYMLANNTLVCVIIQPLEIILWDQQLFSGIWHANIPLKQSPVPKTFISPKSKSHPCITQINIHKHWEVMSYIAGRLFVPSVPQVFSLVLASTPPGGSGTMTVIYIGNLFYIKLYICFKCLFNQWISPSL